MHENLPRKYLYKIVPIKNVLAYKSGADGVSIPVLKGTFMLGVSLTYAS